jgi:hypothetical protein
MIAILFTKFDKRFERDVMQAHLRDGHDQKDRAVEEGR